MVFVNCIGYKVKNLLGRGGFVSVVEIFSDLVKGLGLRGIEVFWEFYIDVMK